MNVRRNSKTKPMRAEVRAREMAAARSPGKTVKAGDEATAVIM
jgi:hypothetical protein